MLGDAPYDINYAENPVVNEKFNSNVEAMNDKAFNSIGDEDLQPKSTLSEYYQTAFIMGNSNAFETLSTEYENGINAVVESINEYVEIAKNAKMAIEEAIAKDKKAHELALAAQALALEKYPAYDPKKDKSGKVTYHKWEYFSDKEKAGEEAYNATWKSNCWKYEG